MARKVYELAKELGLPVTEVVDKLKQMGFNVKNHTSELSDLDYEKGFISVKKTPVQELPATKAQMDDIARKAKNDAFRAREYKKQFEIPAGFRNPQSFSGIQGERMQAHIDELKSNLRKGKYTPEESKKIKRLINNIEDLKIQNDFRVDLARERKLELEAMPELTKKPEQTYRNDPEKLEQIRLEKEASIAAEKNKKPHLQNPDLEMRYTPATKNEYMPKNAAQQAAIDRQKHPTKGSIGKLLTDYNDEYAQVMSKQTAKKASREVAGETGEKIIKEVASEVGEKVGKEAAEKIFKKYAGKIAIGAATGGLSLAAEAASEGLDSTESGARKDMPDYWLERGISDRDEQIQRARLHRFSENLSPVSKAKDYVPNSMEKQRRYEQAAKEASRLGTLRDNYVEDVQEKSDYDKFKSALDSMKEDEDEDKYQNRFKTLRSRLA